MPLLILIALLVAQAVPGDAHLQDRATDLHALVSQLDLTERGTARWLERLEGNRDGPSVERLLAVSATGEHLMERDGDRSSVQVGAELDEMLRRPGRSIVLIHNHPSNVGLSSADISQLAKPGVAAIVAVGHDGSVFAASAGRRMDRNHREARQVTLARLEVKRRLRTAWQEDRVPRAVRHAHLNHLATQALAKAGIVNYWFRLRGSSRESYEAARVVFGHAVVSAAARLMPARSGSCSLKNPG